MESKLPDETDLLELRDSLLDQLEVYNSGDVEHGANDETVNTRVIEKQQPTDESGSLNESTDSGRKHTPLPEGWKAILHESGMRIYFHEQTRVATHSKPYVVNGDIEDLQILPKGHQNRAPAAQYKWVNTTLKEHGFAMDYEDLKKDKTQGEIVLSSPTGAILLDVTSANHGTGPKKPQLMNPMGKTSVALLNEIAQRLVKGSIDYKYDEKKSGLNLYEANVILSIGSDALNQAVGQIKETLTTWRETARNNKSLNVVMKTQTETQQFSIGHGVGENKRMARFDAAKNVLLKLLPEMNISDNYVCNGTQGNEVREGFEETKRELFKKVKVDSPKLVELCINHLITKPFRLLTKAVKKSLRFDGMRIEVKKFPVSSTTQLSRVSIELGDWKQEAEAKGVKIATDLAAQLLFKQLHPEIANYGSLLDLYDNIEEMKKMENAKLQHKEVVRVQNGGNQMERNLNILAMLKKEMNRLKMIHPPRKFLYGVSSLENTGQAHKQSTFTQTTDDLMNQKAFASLSHRQSPSHYQRQQSTQENSRKRGYPKE